MLILTSPSEVVPEVSGHATHELATYGRPLSAIRDEIEGIGGPQAYLNALLMAVDGYLQIHESKRPDQAYIAFALNSALYAFESGLVSFPASMLTLDSPHPAAARAAEHLFHHDHEAALRLPQRAAIGPYGVDAVHAASGLLRLWADPGAPIEQVSALRVALRTVRELTAASCEIATRSAPRSAVEYGDVMLSLAAQSASRVASLGESMPDEVLRAEMEFAEHAVKAGRNALGVEGLAFNPTANAACKTIREACRATCRMGGWGALAGSLRERMPQRADALAAIAGEYEIAAGQAGTWFEAQPSDVTCELFRPVAFIDGCAWALVACRDAYWTRTEDPSMKPFPLRSEESCLKLISGLRSRLNNDSIASLDHLLWAPIRPGDTTGITQLDYRTWAEIISEAPVVAPVRSAAFGL